MNERMKTAHWERITSDKARAMYETLCAACEARDGGMTDADQMLVSDIAYAEQVKELLAADIVKRGIGKEAHNGRQTYWQDNKSLAHLRAYCEQQRKALAELKLTPAGRRAASVPVEDDFDSFE